MGDEISARQPARSFASTASAIAVTCSIAGISATLACAMAGRSAGTTPSFIRNSLSPRRAAGRPFRRSR